MSCDNYLNCELNRCTDTCFDYKRIPYEGVSD